MLLLIIFVLFYIVLQDRSVRVSTEELISSYNKDISEADKKFNGREIELSGEVKSFLQFGNQESLLELEANGGLKIYCILLNKQTEEKATLLTKGTPVTIYGKCLGLNPNIRDKFANSIYIEAERIK